MPTLAQKSPWRVMPNGRKPLSRGMGYGMLYEGREEKSPTIPLPVRSSLFQQVLVHRWQISSYISQLRNYGMRPDHPAVKVLTMINSAPNVTRNQRPTISSFGRSARPGTMQPLRRFTKALPARNIPYSPPEY